MTQPTGWGLKKWCDMVSWPGRTKPHMKFEYSKTRGAPRVQRVPGITRTREAGSTLE